ncbi:MAG: YggU family protein [Bdellovibrionales bacterium]|nr:YggU family protein [Bdellovibrionales bacterium]
MMVQESPENPPWLKAHAASGGVVIHVLAQPKASRNEVVGPHGDRLKIRVAAPPVEGAANEELLRFLGKTLGVPGSRLELIRGASAKQKDVRVSGLALADVYRILSGDSS